MKVRIPDIFCDNYVPKWWVEFDDELSWLSQLFILFAENSQILQKVSVIPILLAFIYLVALNLLVKFMFSKKATEIDKIFTVDLTLCSHTTYTIRNKSSKCAGMGLNGFQIR